MPVPSASISRDGQAADDDGLSESPKNLMFTNLLPHNLPSGQRSMLAGSSMPSRGLGGGLDSWGSSSMYEMPSMQMHEILDSDTSTFAPLPLQSESSSSSGSFSLGIKPSPQSAFSSPLRKSLTRPMARRPMYKRH